VTTVVGALVSRHRRAAVSSVVQQYGILIALLAVGVFLSARSSSFLTEQNMLNILDQMAITGVMAVGMTVLMISGSFDLSVGSTLGLTAALSVGLAHDLTLAGSIVFALAVGIAIGLVNGLVVTKAGINSLIVTLGMLSLVRGVVLIYSNGQSIENPSARLTSFANSSTILPHDTWILIAIGLVGVFILGKTTIGRYVTAVGGNPEAAHIAGVRVDRYRIGAFMAMGVLAAVAGVLYAARFGSVDPNAGDGMELDVIAAVIIGGTSLLGGVGSIWKSLVGVALLTVLTNGFNLLNVNPYYQYVVKGLVIILAVALYTRRGRR
jgi:ribose/xylose/arabinose/galactoside ABC-type transport system permease subunit